MSLRTIVPTLGFLALTAGVANAADSGLNIGGFVDTIASASDAKDAGVNPVNSVGGSTSGVYYDMQAAVELRLGYKLNDKVGAKADVEWNNGTYNGHPATYLEQAFVNYNFTDTVSLTGGKFTSYAGWISADADGLYRINAGPLVSMYQPELVGGALNVAPNKQLGISLFLVNGLGLFTNAGSLAAPNADSSNDNPDKYLSAAFDVVYTINDIGTVNGEFGYDYHGSGLAAWEAGVNATIKPKAAEGLTVGAEVLYENFKDDAGTTAWSGDSSGVGIGAATGDGKRLGAMLMVNHTIPIGVPASVTVMGQYVSTDADNATDKVNTEEVSVALLTNPTGDSKFGFNSEIAYQTSDPGVGDSNDSWWAGIEMIAVIP